MATTTIDFAWAMPVDIVQLGAHLEAYDTVQPMINTLRLCNRFGRGDKAAITKLPVELVLRVEEYLMIEERVKLLNAWATDLRCWKGQCRPIEHMSNAQILKYYNAFLRRATPECYYPEEWRDAELCKKCGTFHLETELTKAIVDEVAHEVEDDYEAGGEGKLWRSEHDKKVTSWFKRVGAPTDKSRGSFDRLSAVLVKHFGLELWSSHVREDGQPRFQTSNHNHSTQVYLRLPTKSSVQYKTEPEFIDYEFDPRRVKTETSFAGAMSLPHGPIGKSLERFPRAVKALDLSCVLSRPSASALNFKNSRESDNISGGKDRVLPGTLVPPQLTMFVRANDPTEDW